VKYRFVERHKKAWPIGLMCKVLQISSSAYYAWRKRPESERKRENNALIPLVQEIHTRMRKSYGTRRMAKELRKQGVDCGRNRARTLMRVAGVQVKQKKKFCITTDSNHNLPIAANLLNRQFDVSEPNRYWVSDITYIWTAKGWLYLATVMERFFHSLKSEHVYHMNYKTPEQAKTDIVDYIEMFYNSNRAHSYLGYLSPNEYVRVTHQLPMAA